MQLHRFPLDQSQLRLDRTLRSNKHPLSFLPYLSLVLVCSFLVPAYAQNDHKTLRTIHEVNRLSNIEARNAYPVQLEGIVTYSDAEWGLLFLDDSTGSIYVNVHGQTNSYPPGGRLRVEAVTGPGDVGTVLVNPKIQLLGQGVLPAAERKTLSELNQRTADSRFVQTRGVLRAGDQDWQRICFRLVDGNDSALVVVPQPANQRSRRFVGSTARITGVSGVHIDAKGKVVGTLIFMNSLDDIKVEGGAAVSASALAVIVNKNNPTNDLRSSDLRRILLGERKFWSGSRKIVLLLPTVGTREREAALRLVGMEESEYKQYWQQKTSSGEAEIAPAAVAANGIAVSLVAQADDAIAVVPLGDVRESVKMVKIDGLLPSDSGYPLH